MLKAYFDSSKDERGVRSVTLSGLVASEVLWPAFEAKWMAVLDEYGLRCFHMTYAMATPPRGIFKEWPNDKVQGLVIKLLNVLGTVADQPFLIISCTVDLEAYKIAKQEISSLRPSQSICVDYCCGSTFPIDPAAPNERLTIEMYFDRNEAFLQRIDQVWRQAKNEKTGWPSQVKQILPITNNEISPVPALQAADVVAWLMNARYCGNRRARSLSLMLLPLAYHRFYDYDEIKNRYPRG